MWPFSSSEDDSQASNTAGGFGDEEMKIGDSGYADLSGSTSLDSSFGASSGAGAYGGAPAGGFSAGGSPNSRKEALMDNVRGQLAVANAQELLQKITEKSYKMCVTRPGQALDAGERQCIAKAMDRYMEAWNLVSRAYATRLQRDSRGMQQ
eukprot:Clim_evm6s73 gene=Clim_evmTU6s73